MGFDKQAKFIWSINLTCSMYGCRAVFPKVGFGGLINYTIFVTIVLTKSVYEHRQQEKKHKSSIKALKQKFRKHWCREKHKKPAMKIYYNLRRFRKCMCIS